MKYRDQNVQPAVGTHAVHQKGQAFAKGNEERTPDKPSLSKGDLVFPPFPFIRRVTRKLASRSSRAISSFAQSRRLSVLIFRSSRA